MRNCWRILTERRARWEAKQLAKFEEQGAAEGLAEEIPGAGEAGYFRFTEVAPLNWVWASGEQLCEFITKAHHSPQRSGHRRGKDSSIPQSDQPDRQRRTGPLRQGFCLCKDPSRFFARSAVYPDDVLMNIVGPPLGQVAVVPKTFPEWNINQAIAIFRAVDGVLPAFICCHLLSPVAQKWLKARSKTTADKPI